MVVLLKTHRKVFMQDCFYVHNSIAKWMNSRSLQNDFSHTNGNKGYKKKRKTESDGKEEMINLFRF